MERISGVLARRRPSGVRAVALTLSIAALIGAMLPAVSTASDGSHGLQTSPMLMRGSGYGQPKGSDDVRALQRRLRHGGFAPGPIDGFFGPFTEGALRRLQAAAGLAPDGVLGPATYKALRRARPAVPALALGAGVASRDGVREVDRLQRDLRALGFAPGPLDGRFGRRTEAAVERFQRSVHLAVDGVVGPMTSGELLARSAPTRQRTESEHAATSDGRRETDAARAAQPVALPKDAGPQRDEPDELADFVANPLALGAVALMSLAVVVLMSMLAPRLLPAVAGKPRGRALGYVSVAQSTMLDSASVLAQIGAIHEACGAERLSLVEVVHDIDRSQAKPLERPGVQYALNRIAAGDATHLVVAKETALWRSKAEVGEVLRELSRRGGLIYSVNGEPETAAWAGARIASGRQGSPVRRFILDQPASADAAGATRTMIGSTTPDLSGSERYALMLAATEVVNNAVLHAGQRGEGDIRVELAVSEGRVRFAVRDDGSGFDVPQSPRRGDPNIGGWGLYLVDAIADRWGVEHEPTTVWLEVARH